MRNPCYFDIYLINVVGWVLSTGRSLSVTKGFTTLPLTASNNLCPALQFHSESLGTQAMVSMALGVPSSKVVCRTKRMGGALGGKETRTVPLATAVAVAASVSVYDVSGQCVSQ